MQTMLHPHFTILGRLFARITIGLFLGFPTFSGWSVEARAALETAAVMAPLDIPRQISMPAFEQLLDEAKQIGVDTVTVDVWWGKVEQQGDQQFDWSYYDEVFEKIRARDLKIVPILSFHKCGGGPGDDCAIPLPPWLSTHFGQVGIAANDLQYESETGRLQDDAIVPWATEKQAVLDQFREFMQAFATHYAAHSSDFVELNISFGPTGELRYPSYNTADGWNYPDRGYFQAYSALAQTSFRNWALGKFGGLTGVANRWGIPLASPAEIRAPGGHLPPTAGKRAETFVNDRDYADTPYGRDFIDWYNESLVEHGRRMLVVADAAFGGAFQSIPLGMKIPGVHWQMMSCAPHPRIAEVTAGLVQTTLDLKPESSARADAYGYRRILDMIADVKHQTGRDVILHFTAAEMDNDSACGDGNSMAEALVFWISQAARDRNIHHKSENALACIDKPGDDRTWESIRNVFSYASYRGFTLLRLVDRGCPGDAAGSPWGTDKAGYASFIRDYRAAPSPKRIGHLSEWQDCQQDQECSSAMIEKQAPGFYKEGDMWYAIIHVPASVQRVRLFGDFTNARANAIDLTQTPDKQYWWFLGSDASFARPPRAGDRYAFLIGQDPDTVIRQDPAARRVIDTDRAKQSGIPLDSPRSIVTLGTAYSWHDGEWTRPAWYRHIIYELHPLRFTDRNQDADGKPLTPFQQITEELNHNGTRDYLNRLGVTAIELMPVNEFNGWMGWGYNPSFFYAIESNYGTPDQLKELVDTAHRHGIAVIFDVVYNHGGNDDNILWVIAQKDIHDGTYYDGKTQWGPLVNFDNPVTRHFFAHNAAYLAKEFHLDGIRFDFTRPIHIDDDWNITKRGSGGGWDFLREIRAKVKAVDPGIVLIAEELPNDWYVTREDIDDTIPGDQHAPFDAQWSDPFHDEFEEVLKGGHLDKMKAVLASYGDSWQDAVVYTESHDEAGNVDGRVARIARDGKGWPLSQVAAAGTLLARGIPMVFMGQESGEREQFKIDHNDKRLPLNDYETDSGRTKVREWYARMMEIRKNDPTSFAWPNIQITHIHDGNGVIAFTRNDGKYLVVLNFKGKGWDQYKVGVSGRYRELANTSWPKFNVGGVLERSRGGDQALPVDDGISIPPYGAVVLRREG